MLFDIRNNNYMYYHNRFCGMYWTDGEWSYKYKTYDKCYYFCGRIKEIY